MTIFLTNHFFTVGFFFLRAKFFDRNPSPRFRRTMTCLPALSATSAAAIAAAAGENEAEGSFFFPFHFFWKPFAPEGVKNDDN